MTVDNVPNDKNDDRRSNHGWILSLYIVRGVWIPTNVGTYVCSRRKTTAPVNGGRSLDSSLGAVTKKLKGLDTRL